MKQFFSEYKMTITVLIVSSFIVISYIFTDNLLELFVYGDELYKLFSDLSLAYIAGFIFFIIVNYLPEKRKRIKYQEIAFQQLERPIKRHISLFIYIYKASILEIHNKEYKSFEELFSDKFYEAIKKFDITKQAPVNSKKSWVEYIALESIRFASSLEKITDKYSYYLNSEMLILIEKIRNSYFISLFMDEAETRIFTENEIWVHVDNVVQLFKYNNCSVFDVEGEKNIIKEHIMYLISLVNLYNKFFPNKPIEVNNLLWKDKIAPQVGSARKVQNVT